MLRTAFFFALLVASSPVRADAPNAPSLPPPDPAAVSIQAYGERNPTCEEWTNTCQVCRRTPDNQMACSTPGIACQPTAPVCKTTRKTP